MQFKHPELLYALILLVIPIIVHLFQLRRFKKVPFTNVAFLKNIVLQTRKSSQLKKWLTLLTRLLLLALIIIAFAQPYTANKTFQNKVIETAIYLDNSYSMQAKGQQGELLKRAIQDLINTIPEDKTISLFTNDKTFKSTTIQSIKNDLLQLEYSANQVDYDAALLKANTLFSNQDNIVKQVILISDFQQKRKRFVLNSDSLTHITAVKLNPVSANNISIDSVYISNNDATNLELFVKLSEDSNNTSDISISLFNDEKLLAKTAAVKQSDNHHEATFSLPNQTSIRGKISIDDTYLQFDNSLFFSINPSKKINVLAINNADDNFLKRIYSPNEFEYTSNLSDQINFNLIEQQHLIILNELNSISNALSVALNQFTDDGGKLIVIPNTTAESYNSLLNNYGVNLETLHSDEKLITSINFSHPLYNNGVFEKQVSNFQYPKVNSHYSLNSNNLSKVLSYEDQSPFLAQFGSLYLFTSSLNNDATNFKNSPLIVPTFYNIAKQSLNLPTLYYTIGNENSFDIKASLQQDHVLHIEKDGLSLIPQQRYFNNKVNITTNDLPNTSGIYDLKNGEEFIEHISFNYNRDESVLIYHDLSQLNNLKVSNSVPNVFNTLKSDSKINELWKWFVIFALAFLFIEMLILKYLK